jgi:hypothetical protein
MKIQKLSAGLSSCSFLSMLARLLRVMLLHQNSNRKDIISMSKLNETSIQKFVETPTREITLIRALLPKMEKFEHRMRQSIDSYISPFKQHHFPQGDVLNQTFETWTTHLKKSRTKKGEASLSCVGQPSIGEDSNSQGESTLQVLESDN